MIIVDIMTEAQGTNFSACQKMTSAIVAMKNANGQCSKSDLLAKNFSHEEIRSHWDMACWFARFDEVEA